MDDASTDATADTHTSSRPSARGSTSAHNWCLTVWPDKLPHNEFINISEQVRECLEIRFANFEVQ